MKDILLTQEGDLYINDLGDIEITDSVRQAVKIRLLWFLNEWRFAPDFGLPYFEEVLIKNPNLERIKRLIRDEVMSVEEVIDVKNIKLTFAKPPRKAHITLEVVLLEETYREEVIL